MIFDRIENRNSYHLQSDIYMALNYLAKLNYDCIPSARVSIDGSRIFADPVSLISKPLEECKFEAHRRFIDLHYILSGTEGISTANVMNLTSINSFDETADIGFFHGKEDGTYFLTPGCFMVCWPQDAHRVAMMRDSPAKIKKIVVKIKI